MRFSSPLTLIPCVLLLGSTSLAGHAVPRPREAHPVTMHLESFTGNGVVTVHVWSVPVGLHIVADSASLDSASLRVRTPSDVRVSAAVKRVEIQTDSNLAIRVTFTEGASPSERALHSWGRKLLFVRVDGDLQPRAEVLPAQP
ncbi:MAG TPA: hypothetical protein VJN70_13585 [Gemmatimonadaceae bacterium]|nr:hypothetical protein [Gemmatimonadaceae bacterium]